MKQDQWKPHYLSVPDIETRGNWINIEVHVGKGEGKKFTENFLLFWTHVSQLKKIQRETNHGFRFFSVNKTALDLLLPDYYP